MENEIVEGVGVPMPLPEGLEAPGETGGSPLDRVKVLRRVHVFADLPEDQLKWFADNTEEVRLDVGDILFRKNDPPEWMVVYLEGELRAYRDETAHDDVVYISRAGDPVSEVTGMLPFSRMTKLNATGRAVTPTRILKFP